jgi:hypothetical protein
LEVSENPGKKSKGWFPKNLRVGEILILNFMKNLFLTFSLICFLVLANGVFSNVSGQEDPYRVGIKIGYPQLAGLNFEYVTPLLNKRLAADLDFSYIPLKPSQTTLTFTDFGLFADYYFSHEGRGLYGGFGYSRMGFNATKTLSDGSKGTASPVLNSLGLKIGGKHGKSFYFRWELGYSLALSSPVFEAVSGTSRESFSSPITGSGPIANIGFGFAF